MRRHCNGNLTRALNKNFFERKFIHKFRFISRRLGIVLQSCSPIPGGMRVLEISSTRRSVRAAGTKYALGVEVEIQFGRYEPDTSRRMYFRMTKTKALLAAKGNVRGVQAASLPDISRGTSGRHIRCKGPATR